MSKTLVIAKREFSSFFLSPIAYVVICLFLLLCGLFFVSNIFSADQPAELRYWFTPIIFVLIAITPAISMRLMSEELRSGTIEPLMTSPVSDGQVIVGKWLGAWGFFATLLLPTLVYVIVLEIWADPDLGPLVSGYVGLLLVGGLYLAIGTFASVLSRNQIIAFMLTVFIILFFTVVMWIVPQYLPPKLAQAGAYLNVNEQYEDFAKGLIDISNITYFVSGIALFLILATKTLESRKWR